MSSRTAFKYRMPGGVPGDINRTHPASVDPCAISQDHPPTLYGQAVVIDTDQTARVVQPGDTAITFVWGLAARPYPISDPGAANANGQQGFGTATPSLQQPLDVMRQGYMTVSVPSGQTPKKGDPVFVWCAANSGAHVQGGIEATGSGGNTAALDPERYAFNGSPDADGNVEVVIQ